MGHRSRQSLDQNNACTVGGDGEKQGPWRCVLALWVNRCVWDLSVEEEHRDRQSPAFLQVSVALCSQSPRCDCLLLKIVQTLPMHIYVHAKNLFFFFPFQPHSHSQKPKRVKSNVKGAGNTSKTICRLYVTDLINISLQYLSNSTQVIHWPCYSHAASPRVKMGQINFHS